MDSSKSVGKNYIVQQHGNNLANNNQPPLLSVLLINLLKILFIVVLAVILYFVLLYGTAILFGDRVGVLVLALIPYFMLGSLILSIIISKLIFRSNKK